ncbi:hypothetical protein [Sorlinia euscelidii]|uniref:Uncharacterized protein n=1 Tax=Sorlinia euscelidii TaxID=3081148 RepID=A0ABU7U3M0_9PROT
MTTWTLIKSFSVCLICTIIAHVAASWSAHHMLDQQMHHAITAMKAHGWHVAYDPIIQKQTRLFGAAITYRNIDIHDDTRHRFSARALTVTHHPFLRPHLDFSTVMMRRIGGISRRLHPFISSSIALVVGQASASPISPSCPSLNPLFPSRQRVWVEIYASSHAMRKSFSEAPFPPGPIGSLCHRQSGRIIPDLFRCHP